MVSIVSNHLYSGDLGIKRDNRQRPMRQAPSIGIHVLEKQGLEVNRCLAIAAELSQFERKKRIVPSALWAYRTHMTIKHSEIRWVMERTKRSWQTDEQRWQAVVGRDPKADGAFLFAVRSTKIYCRPSCPARRPRRHQVQYFSSCEAAELAGFRPCLRCRPRAASIHGDVVVRVCRWIEKNLEEPPSLHTLGARVGMSPFHLQRIFKAALGVSPREFADNARFRAFKSGLKQARSITDAIYTAGYGSSSRAYERTAARLGMTPSRYRRGGERMRIHYTTAGCPLGRLLIAATEKGVCAICLGDSDGPLESSLREEFPAAEIHRDGTRLDAFLQTIQRHISGDQPRLDLPLDIRGTAFQSRVWRALRMIPYGQTRSYSQVARAIRRPKAIRAVARACATNPVALLVPCHRVLREDGTLAGYRWGSARKACLLEREKRESKYGES